MKPLWPSHVSSPRWVATAAALVCSASLAQTLSSPEAATAAAESPASASLAPVTITGRHYDNSVGSSDAASQGVIRAELLASRPALRPGEVLEFVPGLIVTQHSGDGKAN